MRSIPPLRADLHSHTYYSPDAITSPERLVRACIRRGINCLAVTEHNTIEGALAVEKIAPFKVIIGEEVRTAEGEIIGLFLQERVPPGLTAEETMQRIKEQGGLVYIPHPFDRFRQGLNGEALMGITDQVDVVEVFNGRVTVARYNRRAAEFAREHGLAMGAGSDAHSPWELGRVYVEMEDFNGPQSFLEALRQGRIVGQLSSPLVHVLSRWAWLRRKLGWRPLG